MKLVVLDRSIALFPVDPGNLDRGYLEVSQGPVVSALVALFEKHWASGRDGWEEILPEVTLSSRERALVALLAPRLDREDALEAVARHPVDLAVTQRARGELGPGPHRRPAPNA